MVATVEEIVVADRMRLPRQGKAEAEVASAYSELQILGVSAESQAQCGFYFQQKGAAAVPASLKKGHCCRSSSAAIELQNRPLIFEGSASAKK